MTLKSVLLVALGGALGSALRYGISVLMKNWHTGVFPWHTFAVNLSGCFIAGLLLAWFTDHSYPEATRLFLMIGVLGGFTTFSGFGLEVFNMMKENHFTQVILYLAGSNILGILLVYTGYQIVKIG